MKSFDKRNSMYEEDPSDREIRTILDDIDIKEELYKDIKKNPNIEFGLERMFWGEDANKFLNEIGINKPISIENVPEERFQRLYDRYYKKSVNLNDDAMLVDVDPTPQYYAGNGSLKKELFDFGYSLGQLGEVGRYYKLLVDITFCRGFWLGKFEKAISLDDDNIMLEIKKDIEAYDPDIVKDEMSILAENCFTNTDTSKDEKGNPKKL